VLAREHVMYPRAVRWFVDGLLRVDASGVTHTRGEPQLL
jgi:phosphoribosylglycinamide formyltransferase-1